MTLSAVLGWALFLPFALHVTLSHSYLPRHLGTASGVTLGMATALGGLLTPLLGVLADGTSPQAVFAALAGVIAAAFLCSLFLRERSDLPAERATLVVADMSDDEAVTKACARSDRTPAPHRRGGRRGLSPSRGGCAWLEVAARGPR